MHSAFTNSGIFVLLVPISSIIYGKKSIWGKKKKPSSELFPGLTQQLNFYAGYFLASLLLIANFFNFPLKILICMIGLSSLEEIFLVFNFYLIFS